MTRLLLLFLFTGCTVDARGPETPTLAPPCASVTGSECHLVEVAAWSTCERQEHCGGLAHEKALECQVATMYELCADGQSCASDVQATAGEWEALNQCATWRENYPCGFNDPPPCLR